jgi:hypothetical protein
VQTVDIEPLKRCLQASPCESSRCRADFVRQYPDADRLMPGVLSQFMAEAGRTCADRRAFEAAEQCARGVNPCNVESQCYAAYLRQYGQSGLHAAQVKEAVERAKRLCIPPPPPPPPVPPPRPTPSDGRLAKKYFFQRVWDRGARCHGIERLEVTVTCGGVVSWQDGTTTWKGRVDASGKVEATEQSQSTPGARGDLNNRIEITSAQCGSGVMESPNLADKWSCD